MYLKKEEPEQKPEASKILFTGLDEAGKTSIILSLQREFSKIAVLSPTRGAQRRVFDFLGKEISEWDLGGQISYRISYLKNPGKFFDGTEIAIYVIDIQNKPRIPEAISYFKDVIDQFIELEIEPPIYVFLHKYDPALRRGALNEMENLIIDLKEQVKGATDYKEIYFYETSIYDFSSIISAMSEILLNLYPKSELIEKTIIEFAKKIDSAGVVVIDDNSLIIGAYYKDDETKPKRRNEAKIHKYKQTNKNIHASNNRAPNITNMEDISIFTQYYSYLTTHLGCLTTQIENFFIHI